MLLSTALPPTMQFHPHQYYVTLMCLPYHISHIQLAKHGSKLSDLIVLDSQYIYKCTYETVYIRFQVGHFPPEPHLAPWSNPESLKEHQSIRYDNLRTLQGLRHGKNPGLKHPNDQAPPPKSPAVPSAEGHPPYACNHWRVPSVGASSGTEACVSVKNCIDRQKNRERGSVNA